MAGETHPNGIAAPTSTALAGRDGGGKFARTIDTAERDAEAARLKARGFTYRQIAAAIGVDVSTAHDMVKRILRETVQEPADELRLIQCERYEAQLLRLEAMERTVHEVLARKHYAFSNGRLMMLPGVDGEPGEILEDDDVVLRAVAQLASLEDRRMRVAAQLSELMGLKIPVKQEIQLDAGVEYRIIGVDLSKIR